MAEPRDSGVSVLEVRLAALHADVTDMKDALSNLTTAITKLALVEERQSQSQQAVERAFASITKLEVAIEKLTNRITSLEIKSPLHDKAATWIERIAIAAVSVVGMGVLSKVGII
jgi:uncharacterized protein YlxW (UPF0749 family)